MDIDAVFFDLYGTLLIYGDMDAAWTAWLQALHDRMSGLGVAIEAGELEKRCDGFFGRPEPDGNRGGLTVYEHRLKELCDELVIEAPLDEIRRMATETATAWQRYVELDPEARPVLAELEQRLRLGLVSNFDHPPYVRALLRDTGLLGFFDVVVVSGDVGIKKPDPGIFSPPLRELGLDPARVAYVGDAPEDMMAADAAGLVPILLRRQSGTTWQEAADFKSDSQTGGNRRPVSGAFTVTSLKDVVPLVL
jgi:putative hydrolase of the HAD superfamily